MFRKVRKKMRNLAIIVGVVKARSTALAISRANNNKSPKGVTLIFA